MARKMYRLLYFFNDFQSFVMKIVAFVLMYLAPISNYVHLVLILIAIDLVTGSYAAVKSGDKFSARKLRNTLEKFVFYAICIIVAFVLQQIIDDGSELARIIALYIGATEAKSIYENVSRITKTDIVTQLWDLLKSKLDDMVTAMKSNKQTKP